MELIYKLTEEDYIDFNLYHAKNSKTVKKQILMQRTLVPVIYIVLAYLASIFLDVPFLILLVPFLIMGILWFFFYPSYFYRLIKRNATKMMREGKNEGVLGAHKMIFTQHGLREINPKGETSISWSGIDSFGEGHAGFYLYNSGMSALIIPKKELVNSEKVRGFLKDKIGQ